MIHYSILGRLIIKKKKTMFWPYQNDVRCFSADEIICRLNEIHSACDKSISNAMNYITHIDFYSDTPICPCQNVFNKFSVHIQEHSSFSAPIKNSMKMIKILNSL